jgi:hypothetical protein
MGFAALNPSDAVKIRSGIDRRSERHLERVAGCIGIKDRLANRRSNP